MDVSKLVDELLDEEDGDVRFDFDKGTDKIEKPIASINVYASPEAIKGSCDLIVKFTDGTTKICEGPIGDETLEALGARFDDLEWVADNEVLSELLGYLRVGGGIYYQVKPTREVKVAEPS